MCDRIRVLIADDQAISREGVWRILEHEEDIEIAGVVGTAPDVLPRVRTVQPDVLLLDLKWHQDDLAMSAVVSDLRRECPRTCIIGLTVYNQLIQTAKDAGAAWVANKDIGKDELLNLIRAAHASATGIVDPRGVGEAKAAMKRLRGMETGKQHALHEELVHRILTVILHPHLTNPASQAKTAGGRQRRDVLFSNRSPHLFWQSMRQKHDATQIVFELKNVKKLRPEHIRQTAAYLTAGLGRLGFVVSRTPASARMIEHAVDVFRTENQKVVLFLCDDHLEQMLNKKAAGRDPTEVIEKVYDDFIRHT